MTILASPRFFQQIYSAFLKSISKFIILDKALVISSPNPVNYVIIKNNVLLNALYNRKASNGCETLTDNQLTTY
jgi:hypothetical protein